jgi:hypothetical protein
MLTSICFDVDVRLTYAKVERRWWMMDGQSTAYRPLSSLALTYGASPEGSTRPVFSSPDGSDDFCPPVLSIFRPCFSSRRPSARPLSGCGSVMRP